MRVIYKYPLNHDRTILVVPFFGRLIKVDYDANNELSAWFLHDLVQDEYAKFEFLVVGTGQEITDRINGFDVQPGGFDYFTTVKQAPFIWHVFTRQLFE